MMHNNFESKTADTTTGQGLVGPADAEIGDDNMMPPRAIAAGGGTNDENTSQAPKSKDMTLLCVHCGHSGSDVMFSCINHCSYHARCLDLVSVQKYCLDAPMITPGAGASGVSIKICLNCKSEAISLEILPLALNTVTIGRSQDSSVGFAGKRPFQVDSHECSEGYDPNTPRTGRWVPSEISFRDALQFHFTSGSLPLREEYKLIDFLSDILKSKQSRLTKKMKHANLSVQHYCLNTGYLPKHQATELSRLEDEFVASLPAKEQQEIRFHMSRLWREHLADRLSLSNVPFDLNRWINSVETLEKLLNEKQEQERTVKRRIMMGKAWQEDSKREEGIFVNGLGPGADADFDPFGAFIEGEDFSQGELAGDAAMKSLFTSFANETEDVTKTYDTSGEEYNSSLIGSVNSQSQSVISCQSSAEPNFRFAAPFLAWVISYIERTNIPFEHVDIWCPSSMPHSTCGMGPPPSILGSGVNATQSSRLYFAGSATSRKQMVPANNGKTLDESSLVPILMPLEQVEWLSLFGHYSEKFSFSNGCGLPGRVFQTGQPEWNPYLSTASSATFERRGGATQFGIQTAFAVPIKCSNVGRIVLAFYSRNCRERDNDLINRIIRDVQAMNPCPRFKLIVDMGDGKEATAIKPATAAVAAVSRTDQQAGNVAAPPQPQATSHSQEFDQTEDRMRALVTFLCEHMPSTDSSPLASQTDNIMSLRLILLRSNRSPDEQHLVDSMLVLFESYLSAQRSPTDITMMLGRDYAFHDLQRKQTNTGNGRFREQQMQDSSPPHRIVPMPSEQNAPSFLSLDHSTHSLPGHSFHSLPDLSTFSLNSVDHSRNPPDSRLGR